MVPILMSIDHPMLSTACWHTNNQITTTLKHRHAPKKHIQKNHILCTSIFKQEGGSGSVGHSCTASEIEPSLVPQSCMYYMIKIWTGIYFTRFHDHPKNLITVEHLFIRFCLVFDHGRGQRAANRSRATAGIQQHAMFLFCFLGFMLRAEGGRMRRVLLGMWAMPITHDEDMIVKHRWYRERVGVVERGAAGTNNGVGYYGSTTWYERGEEVGNDNRNVRDNKERDAVMLYSWRNRVDRHRRSRASPSLWLVELRFRLYQWQ